MILSALFFYLFAGICVASAVMVIVSRNPVHSVLFLILAFVNASGLFVLKALFMFFLFAMAKAIVPRYRYDQLMRLGWKVFLPLSLAAVVVVAAVLQFAGLAPK